MNPGEVRVWDPPVRALHWSLVLLCGAAWATAEHAEAAHEVLGVAILAVVGLRVLWGFIGSRHARFADFVRSPRLAADYLAGLVSGRAKRSLGHNPAGGWSILALLAALLVVAVSGWAATHGPFAAAHWVEEMHEGAAGLLGLLVGVHLAGVIVSSLAGGENLVRAMFTGTKRAP